jgi:hypothetical protein
LLLKICAEHPLQSPSDYQMVSSSHYDTTIEKQEQTCKKERDPKLAMVATAT